MESIKSPIRIAPPGRDRYLGKTMEGVRAAPGMWLLGLGLVAGLGWAFSASNQNHKAVATEDLYSIKVSSIEVYVERATSAFLAMQSANRGFLLTGEPEYRDNFTRDRDKFSSTFADLRRYMAENGLSGDTLSAVKADVTLWFELSNKLIDRKRRGEFGEEDRLPLDECLALESKILRNLDKMLPASALAQRRWTPYVPSKDTTPASDPQQ